MKNLLFQLVATESPSRLMAFKYDPLLRPNVVVVKYKKKYNESLPMLPPVELNHNIIIIFIYIQSPEIYGIIKFHFLYFKLFNDCV